MGTLADVFMDSFESYQNGSEMDEQWVLDDDSAQYLFSTSEIDSLRTVSARGSTSALARGMTTPTISPADYVIMGARCKIANLPAGNRALFVLYRDAAVRVYLQGTDGTATVRWGGSSGTIMLEVPDFFVVDQPSFYELEVYRHAEDGFIGLYRNATLLGSFSGDTTGMGTAPNKALIQNPSQSATSGNRMWLRDFYFATLLSWSSIGGNNLGPGLCHDLPPDTDSAVDFTPSAGSDNFAMVDDLPNDGDTTYNESGTAGHEDLFLPDVSGLPAGPIVAVGVYANARASEAGPLEFGGVMESGTERIAPAGEVLITSYRGKLYVPMQPLDPDDDEPWTPARLAAVKFGYRNIAV